MSRTFSFLLMGLLAIGAADLSAQSRKKTDNPQSPSASTSVKLGGNTVSIEYNAPFARGRAVEGGLIPYGKVWRMGADSATTLTTDADIMIGDVKVPKGVYTLYIHASEKDWKLAINKQTGQWGTQYNADQDLGRATMSLKQLGAPVEKFEILLKESGPKAGTLQAVWGKTDASVPIKLL